MKVVNDCYKEVTSKVNFDINAGAMVNPTLPLSEFVPGIIEHIDNGGTGCCLHSSIYLCKLLNDNGVYSEIVITPEPTVLPDGTTRVDNRASVLYFDTEDNCYYVANPVEDAEVFTRDGIKHDDRKAYYVDDTCELTIDKENVHTKDGSKIKLDDYVKRYGDGKGYQLGTIFGEDKECLSLIDLMKQAFTIDLNDIKEIDERFGVPRKSGM